MVVDRRHDHSFRVPRPDLSAKLGTTNACNDCHTDKPADWAAAADRGLVRPGPRRACRPMARHSTPPGMTSAGAANLLAAVAADAQRARFRPGKRACRARRPTSRRPTVGVAQKRASRSPIPWCGSARSTCSTRVPPDQLWPLVSPLLSDPVRGVRIRAAVAACRRAARTIVGRRPRAARPGRRRSSSRRSA